MPSSCAARCQSSTQRCTPSRCQGVARRCSRRCTAGTKPRSPPWRWTTTPPRSPAQGARSVHDHAGGSWLTRLSRGLLLPPFIAHTWAATHACPAHAPQRRRPAAVVLRRLAARHAAAAGAARPPRRGGRARLPAVQPARSRPPGLRHGRRPRRAPLERRHAARHARRGGFLRRQARRSGATGARRHSLPLSRARPPWVGGAALNQITPCQQQSPAVQRPPGLRSLIASPPPHAADCAQPAAAPAALRRGPAQGVVATHCCAAPRCLRAGRQASGRPSRPRGARDGPGLLAHLGQRALLCRSRPAAAGVGPARRRRRGGGAAAGGAAAAAHVPVAARRRRRHGRGHSGCARGWPASAGGHTPVLRSGHTSRGAVQAVGAGG